MVHLAPIPTAKDIQPGTVGGHSLEQLKLESLGDDNFTTTVYGSKYAALDLPKYEMPETEMPREVAYRMIKFVLTPPYPLHVRQNGANNMTETISALMETLSSSNFPRSNYKKNDH